MYMGVHMYTILTHRCIYIYPHIYMWCVCVFFEFEVTNHSENTEGLPYRVTSSLPTWNTFRPFLVLNRCLYLSGSYEMIRVKICQ